jgi:hypothetical protein
MRILNLVFSALTVLTVVSAAAATKEMDTRKVPHSETAPTKYMLQKVQDVIDLKCQNLTSNDKLIIDEVEVLVERVHSRQVGGQVVSSNDPNCAIDMPCSMPRTVGGTMQTDIFQDLYLRIIRKGGGKSYPIEVITGWAFDEPMPYPDVDVKSPNCR